MLPVWGCRLIPHASETLLSRFNGRMPVALKILSIYAVMVSRW